MNTHKHDFENWDEIRIAYQVARLGTLSAAAAYLGVHHATVIRHIDNLEQRLGCKLFQRHARGYTPTDAGKDLMQVAAASHDQFQQLATRVSGQSDNISGELIVTTLSGLSSLFAPMLIEFQQSHPGIRMSLLVDERRYRLEYGEAHVALRAGNKPDEPDNVVQEFATIPVNLYAHKKYIDKFGMPKDEADLKNHHFVSSGSTKGAAPYNRWLRENVAEHQIVFRAPQIRSLEDAIKAGAGIGFLTEIAGELNPDLVQVLPAKPEWSSKIWLVTHIDLHHSAKIQAFTKFLKARFAEKKAMCDKCEAIT